MKPTIGRIVIYKSKIDNGPGNDVSSPAVVIRTRDTTVQSVIDRWAELAPGETMTVGDETTGTHVTGARPESLVQVLPDDYTVDLLVHGLGKDYREYAVAYGDERGQWSWPERD